jgi:methyl-accepting chemotaxis protein
MEGMNTDYLLVGISCLLIAIFALWNWIRVSRKIKAIKNDLNRGISLVNHSENDHRKYFTENFEKINKGFIEIKALAHSWHEFKEHLLSPTIKDVNPVYMNSMSPDYFFTEDVIVSQQKLDRRWVQSIPGKITALGILGTFIGLAFGVHAASIGIETGELNSAISKLLLGASLAFCTSAVAVVVSLIFSWYEKSRANKIELKISELCDLLDKSLMFKTTVQQGAEQLKVQREQLLVLESFANDLAISLGNVFEEKFSGAINQGFGDVVSILGSLKETQEKLGEGISKEIAKQVTGGVGDQVESQMNEVVSSLQGMQNLMSEQMHQMISSQSALQLETKKMVDEITTNMKENQSTVNGEFLEMMTNVKRNISGFSENMTNNMSSSIDELGAKVIEINHTVSMHQEKLTESMQEANEKSKNIMVEGVGSAIGQINEAVTSLNNSVKNSHEKTVNEVEQVFNNIKNTMNQFDKNIIDMNESTKNQKEIAQISTESMNSFQDIMQKNRDVGNKFETAAMSVSSFSANLAAFNSTIGQYTQQLNSAVDGIKSSNESTADSWSEYIQRFRDIDESLVNMFEQLDQGTRAYGKQVHEHMSELTSKSESVVSLFGGAVGDLQEAVDELTNSYEQRKIG